MTEQLSLVLDPPCKLSPRLSLALDCLTLGVPVDSQVIYERTRSHAIGSDMADLRKKGYGIDYHETGTVNGRKRGTYTLMSCP